jgi:hypothetical protein
MVMALRLASEGIGDTYVPRAHTLTAYFPPGLSFTGFRPIVHETMAIVARRGARPSPATMAFLAELRAHLTTLPGLEAIHAGDKKVRLAALDDLRRVALRVPGQRVDAARLVREQRRHRGR